MSNLTWLKDNRVSIDPPKRPKKITGTRFAAIMGLNKWNTEFKTWCEITRTWEEPFVDTIYTVAGKVIEPKQAEYMRKAYGMYNLITPEDVYGKDYFKKTYGDFFHNDTYFGGMWDYLVTDDGTPNGKVETVLEMKTTKRSEDWAEDIPEYYAMQAALYAWLLECDDVVMVCSFLEDKDYEHPEKFQPSAANTITRSFKVSERYPNMRELIDTAADWWTEHVELGISPAYDPVNDAEIIKALREAHPDVVDTGINALLNEGAEIQHKLDEYAAITKPLEDRLKAIKDAIKDEAKAQLDDDHDKVIYGSQDTPYVWTVARQVKTGMDEAAMKRDGVYEQYHTKKTTSFVLTMKANKEDK